MYSTSYLQEILDKVPIGKFHRRLLMIAGAGFAFDCMEVFVISFTLPLLIKAWNLDLASAGLLGSASLIGMFLGNFMWGYISDKFGRKPSFEATILFYSVFTGLSAFAPSYWWLFALRVMTGIGLGGCLAVDTTMLSENLPSQKRGRYLVLLDSFWPFGQMLAVALAWWLLPNWQMLFIAAAFPALFVALVRMGVRETPYYLAKHGRTEELHGVLDAMIAENKTPVKYSLPAKLELEKGAKRSYSELFSPNFKATSFMIAFVWFMLNFGYYGAFIWLPTILKSLGYQPFELYTFILISAVVQLPGYYSAAYLVDRIGRKKTLLIYLLLSGVFALGFAAVTDTVSMVAMLSLMSFFCLGAWGVVYAYTPELFPTHIRTMGMGFAGGVGKLAAVAAPPLAGIVMKEYSLFAALAMLASSFVLGAAVLFVFGKETKGEKFE